MNQQPYYGQQPYGQQPYGYPQQPPKKSRTGLIVGLVVGLVVLLGGGAVLLVVLLSDSGTSGDPRETAQQYVDAVNNRDAERIVALSCSLSPQYVDDILEELTAKGVELTLSPEEGTESAASAGFWLDGKLANPDSYEDGELRYRLNLGTTNDRWCVTLGARGLPA
ncbi:hypothetical protein [Amycolatopsis albispora]|uniref:DUF4878 domain-containing protein n=1 Tax=Amycolatopsis albispora TaxID=1804986 RepID=A0A344LE65_9PSEU|nr:hypothetical protein [Amycolatopsis albispora]AXB46339.1 hypothetical protein A4R43_30985 [Amycolatopsis albispora]